MNSYSPHPYQKKKNLHASHFYFVNFFIDADFFLCVSYSYQAKRSKQFIYSASRSLPYVFVVIVFLVIRHILYASNFNSKIHNKVVFLCSPISYYSVKIRITKGQQNFKILAISRGFSDGPLQAFNKSSLLEHETGH
jgi:hypothetical protein